MRKAPRLLTSGILGITVWPKWQSSPVYGDIPASGIKGNRSYRRRGVNDGEILLDLSRKVYSICHHHYLKNCEVLAWIARTVDRKNKNVIYGR